MNGWLIFFISIAVPVIVYEFVFLSFRRSWKNYKTPSKTEEEFPFISVVIPFRNEVEHLPNLISWLMRQQYPRNKFEVIAVNDHSTDGTTNALSTHINEWKNLTIIESGGLGKKNALKTGIVAASGEIIATTDADCAPTINWLKTIANSYNSTKSAMLIGPVKMNATKSLFSKFQSFDFMALQMSGAAAAMQGWPVFCSGANLSFEKTAWQNAQNCLSGNDQASGDDVFLLHTFKKLKFQISFIKDNEAMVATNTEKSLKSFLSQRMRWGGKSKSYSDKHTIALALLVLFANFAVVSTFLLTLTNLAPFVLFLILFLVKGLADYLLLAQGRVFFGIAPAILPFLLFALLYPYYIIITAFGGLLLNPSWKGRK